MVRCEGGIAGDTADLEVAQMIEAALVPEPPHDQEPFWNAVAQALIEETLRTMKRSGKSEFTIADMIRAMGPVLEPEPTPEGER
jgi:hypothetical protein